jgi:hypothetical protein
MNRTPRPLTLFDVLFIVPYLILLGTAPVILVKKAGWCLGLACAILLVLLLPMLHRLYFWMLAALVRHLTRENGKDGTSG